VTTFCLASKPSDELVSVPMAMHPLWVFYSETAALVWDRTSQSSGKDIYVPLIGCIWSSANHSGPGPMLSPLQSNLNRHFPSSSECYTSIPGGATTDRYPKSSALATCGEVVPDPDIGAGQAQALTARIWRSYTWLALKYCLRHGC
jgi:hypothetical protein